MQAYHNLDGDAVINLLAFWSSRLGVEGVENHSDPACAVAFAAEKLIGPDNIGELSGPLAFSEGVEIGIRAAIAVLADPLGDPRQRLRAAFTSLGAEV